MAVQALGYLAVGAADLDAWTGYATRQLGLQQVTTGAVSRAFRMDDRKQRILVEREGERVYGWEVADAAALDALAQKLEAAGVAVERGAAALADRRCVTALIGFRDPDGNRLEAFHGPQLADTPFTGGRDVSGFKAGALGLGHVVLMVRDFERAMGFYQGLLGFRISDFMAMPKVAFLHVNPRHHSLALFEHPRGGMHHLMMEFFMLDDVGQSFDIAQAEGRVAATLGRHLNDWMTSFYMRSPSDFLIEQGWGAREVDPATWQPEELTTLASFWGHAGLMQTVADGPPPGPPPPPSPEGRRAPLQVQAGNFQVLPGTCPWLDTLRR